MTGTIDDAFPVSEGAGRPGPEQELHQVNQAGALVEQGKGVLIFRYGISADAAFSLMELWAAENNVSIEAIAHAMVHEICQGDRTRPSEPRLVRWLEDRLRHEFPGVECEGSADSAQAAAD